MESEGGGGEEEAQDPYKGLFEGIHERVPFLWGSKLQLRIAAAPEEEQYNEQRMVERFEMLMDCRSCNSIQSLP